MAKFIFLQYTTVEDLTSLAESIQLMVDSNAFDALDLITQDCIFSELEQRGYEIDAMSGGKLIISKIPHREQDGAASTSNLVIK
jgi:hypothetical protein